MTFLTIKKDHETRLPSRSGLERVHKFDEPSIGAVNAALAAQRPLLVRGEPGVGKTQLAEAVAAELQRLSIRIRLTRVRSRVICCGVLMRSCGWLKRNCMPRWVRRTLPTIWRYKSLSSLDPCGERSTQKVPRRSVVIQPR